MIRLLKAGLLISLVVLSILISSFTLFSKKSYADVPTYGITICTENFIICYNPGPFLCCPTQRPQ